MPTPFHHLALAETVLEGLRLPNGPGDHLHAIASAFRLGSIAPDVCAHERMPRTTTHFFSVPLRDRRPAYSRFLGTYPELANPDQLSPEHSAFIAGYLVHIQLDQIWVYSIFDPIFGPTVGRSSFRQRLVDHNLLRTYLDRQHRTDLPATVAEDLLCAMPDGWLPFASDEGLLRWRDYLAAQLSPGARPQTVEVFAHRSGLQAEAFAARLDSKTEMDQAVFQHVSLRRLKAYDRLSLSQAQRLSSDYLSGRLSSPDKHHNRRKRVRKRGLM